MRARQPAGFELSWWVRALIALAVIRIAGASVMLALTPESVTMGLSHLGVWMIALQLVAYSSAAAVLLFAHARDARTANLGVSLLLIGSAFATIHFVDFARQFPIFAFLITCFPDAFLAVFIGRFVRDFPHRRAGSRTDRFLKTLIGAAIVTGTVLFVANALRGVVSATWLEPVEILQRRSVGGTVYWTTIFSFVAMMLPLVFSGASTWRRDERQRVRFFWGAFVVGFGPTVFVTVLSSLPRIGPRVDAWLDGWLMPLLHLLLASVPVTVAYAVLVQRLLPLRVIVHQALQYVFARWVISGLALVPTGVLIAQAYRHRHETIVAAMSGRAIWLLAGVLLSSAAVVFRSNVLLIIDRWFLREAYDARGVLIDLSERARRAHGIDELVALVTAGIDRALRPETAIVLVRGERGSHFLSLFGAAEPLPSSSLLVDIVSALDGAPLDVDVDDERSPLRWLPTPERQWLADSQSALLVPLAASDGLLVGIISLGLRKSELPYSAEDRRLLAAIADAAALTIENHAFRMSHDTGREAVDQESVSPWWRVGAAPQHSQAKECPECGSVQATGDAVCRRCQSALEDSDVPQVLFGKFRFEERIGRGGMGVVYRASDLMLERSVAIKTLPGTSPEYSQRLRIEAKAMAAVTHRNLATIHGAESWRGRPMLVCEYMEHGTLATKLHAGPLPIAEALELGLALADALQVIHRAGLLHRDIKPSNIGYGAGGVPKLLDFGLVYMIPEAEDLAAQAVVGTPLYMSPEALAGRAPTQMFDLWSLNVLLCEAITGTHPFRGRTTEETMSLIRDVPRPRGLEALRGPFTKIADYFEDALAKESSRRPRTAAEVVTRLRALAH